MTLIKNIEKNQSQPSFEEFKKIFADASKTVSLETADPMLMGRVHTFESLEKKAELYKTITVVLWKIFIIGWIFLPISLYCEHLVKNQKENLLNEVKDQLSKDMERHFIIEMNGVKYQNAHELVNAIENMEGLTLARKYFLFQELHQGFFVPALDQSSNDFLSALGEKYADGSNTPYDYSFDPSYLRNPETSRVYVYLRPLEYNPITLKFDQDGTPMITSSVHFGLTTIDRNNLKGKRDLFRIKTNIEVNANKQEIKLAHELNRTNLTDSVSPDYNSDEE